MRGGQPLQKMVRAGSSLFPAHFSQTGEIMSRVLPAIALAVLLPMHVIADADDEKDKRQEEILMSPKYQRSDFTSAVYHFQKNKNWKTLVKAAQFYEKDGLKAFELLSKDKDSKRTFLYSGGVGDKYEPFYRYRACLFYGLLRSTEGQEAVPSDLIPGIVQVSLFILENKSFAEACRPPHSAFWGFLTMRKEKEVQTLVPVLKKFKEKTKSATEEDAIKELIKQIEANKE